MQAPRGHRGRGARRRAALVVGEGMAKPRALIGVRSDLTASSSVSQTFVCDTG